MKAADFKRFLNALRAVIDLPMTLSGKLGLRHIRQAINSENLRIVTGKINNQNKSIRSNNSTGVTGISKIKVGKHDYHQVQMTDNDDIRHRKQFSITKLGDVESKRQAIEPVS